MRTPYFFVVVISIFLGSTVICFSQGEANIWYFGNRAGLNFNGGAPVPLTNSQMIAPEGCASISDSAGHLLFYTDGIKVWNKNHLQMPNGFGLFGDPSSTQSGVIIRKPCHDSIYYIFTADAWGNSNGIRYSEVNMNLNGGLGDVIVKNILLTSSSCEKITAIKHCNNEDIWVVTHDFYSDVFRTFLVTGAGVNPSSAVLSNVGLYVSAMGDPLGNMKASPDGKKIATATFGLNRFELFDFDNITGTLSNAITFPQLGDSLGFAYGVEFSPDGKKLYFSFETCPKIYQANLNAGSSTAIANSAVLVGVSASNTTGSLQLAPDKKIYLARNTAPWLGVINNPNALGMACNYVDNGVSLAGRTSSEGLPNFFPHYFKNIVPFSFTSSSNCLTGTFNTPIITSCSGSNNVVSWDFGDPTSGANNTSSSYNTTHVFSSAGTYTVTLTVSYGCSSDIVQKTITVVSCGLSATAVATNISCNGQCVGTATANANGTAPYTYSWSTNPVQTTQTALNLCAGTYTVTITDASNFTATSTVTVTQPTVLAAPIITTTPTVCTNNNGTATVSASGGNPAYSYVWSPSGGTGSTATGLAAGNYTVTTTDANGCTQIDSTTIIQTGSITTTINSTSSECTSNNGTATVTASNGTPNYTYSWSPSGGTSSTASNLAPATYTVTVVDANGCTSTSTTTILQTTGTLIASITSTTPSLCTNNNGTATVSASGGNPAYTYAWSPIGGTGSTATNLSPGTYTVTTTDATGCIKIDSTTIIQTNTLTTTATSSPSICANNNGMATVTASNGTPSYTYTWNPSGGAGSTANNLAPGTYTVTVIDANGCTSTAVTTVIATPLPIASVSPDVTIQIGNSTTLTASGGNAYNWFPSTGLNTTTSTSIIASPIQSTTYCVEVTDTNNCKDTACVKVLVEIPCPDNSELLTVPNAFSPNGDGVNDEFCLRGWNNNCIDKFNVLLFDRWGEKIFESSDPDFCWDGKFLNTVMDSQVLVYYIKAKYTNQEKVFIKKGNISLLR